MNIDWSSFGERVLLARRRKKISQHAFAAALGISRNYASMIERGVANPGYEMVAWICEYLAIEQPAKNTVDAPMKASEPRRDIAPVPPCPVCKQDGFMRRAGLGGHMWTVHGIKMSEYTWPRQEKP